MKTKDQLWEEFEHAKPRVSVPRESWDAGWRARGEYLRGVLKESFSEDVSTDELLQSLIDKNENQKRELARLNGQRELLEATQRAAGAALMRVQHYERALRQVMEHDGARAAGIARKALYSDTVTEAAPDVPEGFNEVGPVEVVRLCDEPLCCQVKGHAGEHDDIPF